MDDREIRVQDVEREHLAEVHQLAQWAYLAGVIGLGFLAMVLLIAVLASA